MSLSSEQLAIATEITRESLSDVTTKAAAISPAQENLLMDDLDVWEGLRYSGGVKLKGGSDGVDYDPDRKEAKIFYRVRSLLGFPLVFYLRDSEVLELHEINVGSNFG